VSTALAVAATSRVITAVIDDAVAGARLTLPGILGSATTSSAPPDHLVTDKATEVTNLNLFLYHVTYNQGWREVGLPTRGPGGNTIGRAPLAIDLHYLLSAYSSGDFQAQILLGIGMQALHEVPVLFRQKIQSVFTAPANDVDKALATTSPTKWKSSRSCRSSSAPRSSRSCGPPSRANSGSRPLTPSPSC
jgi:hypothetical protein